MTPSVSSSQPTSPQGPPAVDQHARHLQADQVEGQPVEVRGRGGVHHGARVEPVGRDPVVQVELVAGDVEAAGPAVGQVRVDADRIRRRHAVTGATGLPVQRLPAGMDSPRSTSDAGPTEAPGPRLAAGRTTPCGPTLAPSSRRTVSMLITRSWNRCVWSTHPRFTVAPSPRATRSASGSQYVSHQTPRPMREPSARSHRFIAGEPTVAGPSHGTATTSRNASASSLRQMNPL